MPLRDLILLLFFVGSLPVCFVRPFFGVCMWAVVAFLNPQAYIWGGASFFPWAIAVAIPTLAGMLLFAPSWKTLSSPNVLLIVALWIWFTITTTVSTSSPLFVHHSFDTWEKWKFVSKMLLMTGATIVVVSNLERLRVFVMVMAGSLGFYVVKSLPFVIVTGGSARLYGPENSMIGDNNDFGLALNMTLPLFYLLAQTETKPWIKRLSWFLFFITIPAICLTYSRGALIGLIAVLGVMLLQVKQRLLLVPAIALFALVGFLFAPQSWRDRMDPTRDDAVDASAQSRLNAWAFSWNLASDNPVAGGGFATFTEPMFARYAPKVRDIHGPHSVYFQILAEHGFVGLLLYLTLLASCFTTALRLRKWASFHEDPVIAAYAGMFWLSIVGFLVSGLFLGRAYLDYFFAIVACLTCLETVAKDRWAQMAEESEEESNEAVCEEVHETYGKEVTL